MSTSTRLQAPPDVPSEPQGPRLPLGRIVLGLLLVAGGIGWLLQRLDVWSPRWEVVAPAALIVVGIACVVAAWDPDEHGGLITLGVLLSLAVAALAILPRPLSDLPLAAGIGDRVQRPASVTALEPSYDLSIGTLEIDLTDIEATTRIEVEAQVGVGALIVRVPEDVQIGVNADVGIGEVTLFGDQRGGLGADHQFSTPGFGSAERRLDLQLDVGLGSIEVTR